MQKTFFTILAVVFLSVPLVGQEAGLPENTQSDSTEMGSLFWDGHHFESMTLLKVNMS